MRRRVLCKIAAAVAVAGSLALGTVTTAAAAGLAPPTPAGAAADAASRGGGGGVTPNSQVPPPIRVDETKFKIVATFRGVGAQVYRNCNADGTYKAEPVATLEDLRSRKVVGIHFDGPFWASFDGSKVAGTKVAGVPQSGTSNVDWLLLSASVTPGPRGVFSSVASIQRIDTRGGLPQGACAAARLPISVPYSTNYVFWAPK